MNRHSYSSWFLSYILYNLLFLSAQFAIISFQSSSFIYALTLPTQVYLELLTTLAIHFLLYIILALFQTLLMWSVSQHLNHTNSLWTHMPTKCWQHLIWWCSIIFIVSCNSYFFPLSVFSKCLINFLPPYLLWISLGLSTFMLGILTANTGYCIARNTTTRAIRSISQKMVNVQRSQHRKNTSLTSNYDARLYVTSPAQFIRNKSWHNLAVICLGGLAGTLLCLYSFMPLASIHTQPQQPNIILIGIDSLPPSVVTSTNTPTVSRFIKNSTLFKETISPLARTYPAWTSILTGLYPQHHNAHYNLLPSNIIKSNLSIAWDLKKQGYETIFATDDRRFNNLDSDFGFEKIIGPKVGINDMLLGTFNDYPLSNLLINLPISRWIFPYNYINRASYFSYYPNSFDREIKNAILNHKSNVPLFIAIHFTLPHWPYAYAPSNPLQVQNEYSVKRRYQLYLNAVRRSDRQVAKVLHLLQQQGDLNESVVILLSDHGESFYLPGSRQTRQVNYQRQGESHLTDYFKRKTSTTLDKSAGHGSDLLSPEQYHCLLAFKIYHHSKLISASKSIITRVALIDIAPTLYAVLGQTHLPKFDGISLLDSIIKQRSTLPERAFILESGIFPNQFLSRKKTLLLGKTFFEVNQKTGNLELRKATLPQLNQMKLYGIIKGNWLLALYPDDKGYIPIIQRQSDWQWVDDMHTDFAKASPAAGLLKTMERFYGHSWKLDASTL